MNTTKRKDQEIRQACEVLGLAENAHAEEIRRRYRLLMHSFHPDTAGNGDYAEALAERARQINEAYRTLKDHGKLTMQRSGGRDPHLRQNEAAFCSRRLYMEENLYGEPMYIDTGLYGRYVWEPEMESFPMLLKSVHEAVRKLLEEQMELSYARANRQKLQEPEKMQEIKRHEIKEQEIKEQFQQKKQMKLLHLLLQEFVEPERCLEALAFCREGKAVAVSKGEARENSRSWRIRCHLRTGPDDFRNQDGINRIALPIKAFENRLFAMNPAGKAVGRISFVENELYYIVTPLILQGAASAVFEVSGGVRDRISGELYLKQFSGKWKDPTPAINREIAAMLQRN